MRHLAPLFIALALMVPAAARADHHPRPDVASFFERPRLGLLVVPLTPELRGFFGAPDDRGVLVARVQPDTPAAHAGIQVGDVVTEVDGHAIAEASDVWSVLAPKKTGDAVTVAVIRDHHPRSVTATLARGDREAARELFHLMPWLPLWGPRS